MAEETFMLGVPKMVTKMMLIQLLADVGL